MKKERGGFTLIELVVVLACCSVVTLAAMTFLMTGLRVENTAEEAISQRQTAGIVLTMLENLVGSGRVKTVETLGDDWTLWGGGEDGGDVLLLRYRAADGALTTAGGAVLMDGLESAEAELEDNGLLSIAVQTQEGASYAASVYCRTGIALEDLDPKDSGTLLGQAEEELDPEPSETGTGAGRLALLTALITQYGSTGEIMGADDTEYSYYSEWYIGDYEEHPGWDLYTPWCACFLSWAAQQAQDEKGGILDVVPRFANVDAGMEGFQTEEWGSWRDPEDYLPVPGDYIFFDWSGGDDPEHVGAVLYVDQARQVVYTVEGNSGGAVALRGYYLSDPRIVGYGVLDWAGAGGAEAGQQPE